MKKNLKKGLSLILTVAMVFTLVTGIQAFAAGTKSVDVTSTLAETVIVNTTVDQTISIGNFSTETETTSALVDGVRSFKIVVNYDSTKLTATTVAPTLASGIAAGPIATETTPGSGTLTDGELSVTSTAGKLVILYMDRTNGTTPVLAGTVLTITYTALAEGASDITLSSDQSFLDCSFRTSTVPSEVAQRNVAASFEAFKTITVQPATPPIIDLQPIQGSPLAFDTTGEYVYGIEIGTTVQAVKDMFVDSANVVITGDVDGIVGTGCVISQLVGTDTLTVVILGDLDGNGIITLDDFSLLQQRVIELISFDGAFNLAANIKRSSDGIITLDDFSLLQQRVIELITLTQAPPFAA